MSTKSSLIGSVIFTILLLEISSLALQKSNIVRFEAPSYSFTQIVPFWRDMNRDFGVWHPSGMNFRHVKSCFDVTYHSNSFGARDVERALTSDKSRAVVLGDSFAEGYGLNDEFRLSNSLEKKTGREHLNFGTAGTFGPTQYLLQYKSLAKRFDHDFVIVALLPDNDFLDDDIDFGRQNHADRYRPYWIEKNGQYELVYFQNQIDEKISFNLVMKYVRGFFREFSYGYRALDYLFKLLQYQKSSAQTVEMQKLINKMGYSGYYDFSSKQWEILAHNLSLLANETKGKRVLWVTIPRHGDFVRKQSSQAEPPLPGKMQALADRLGATYLDLLPEMEKNPNWIEYFLACDDHWSPAGSATAAASIQAAETYKVWLKSAD